MSAKLIIHVTIGLVSYGVWAFMAWQDPSLRHDFLAFNITLATGTVGLAIRDMLPSTSLQEPPKSPPEIAQPEDPSISATTSS